jgi:type I restriction enzyme, S subunit
MSEWPARPLGDLARWLSGGTPNTSVDEYWGGDIPWISAASLHSFYIESSDRCITAVGAANGTRLVPTGTTIIIVRGMSLMSEFRLGITKREVAFGQDCKALIPKEGVDPYFLAYAIRAKTQEILKLVEAAGHGTGRLPTDRISSLTVPIPHDVAVQRSTVQLFKGIDDKIAVNERIMTACSDLISWLYIRASANGVRVALNDAVELDLGSPYSSDYFNQNGNGCPLLRIRDTKTFRPAIWTTERIPGDTLVAPGDVVAGMDAEFRPGFWLGEHALLNQRVLRGRARMVGGKESFVREVLREPLHEIERYKTGTTVIHLNKRDLDGSLVYVPEARNLVEFEARAEPLRQRVIAAAWESRALTDLRDTLLRKLMSGEIRVRDAERIVEDAT